MSKEFCPSEEWRPIKSSCGRYFVSNLGRIKSSNLCFVDKAGKKRQYYSKIIKQHVDSVGYLIVSLKINGKKKIFRTHRLIATSFIPNRKNKQQVNHIDSNRTNNKVSNLEWCTPKENTNHGLRYGNMLSGEDSPMSKLSKKTVLEIRSKYKPWKYGVTKLMEEYGLSRNTLNHIVYRRRWRFI